MIELLKLVLLNVHCISYHHSNTVTAVLKKLNDLKSRSQTALKNARVKVFDQPSRHENMIVEIIRDENEETELTRVAEELLGKVVWAGWPHLTRAK